MKNREFGVRIRGMQFLFVVFLSALIVLSEATSAMADWSVTAPDAVYITKTQYRYRTRITKSSPSASEDGWILYQEVPGNWGNWVSNGSTPVTASLDCEVKTVAHPEVTAVTGYSYRRYKYYNSSVGKYYLTYGENWATSHGYSGTWEYKTVTSALGTYKQYDGVQAYGNSSDFWFYQTENRTVTQAAYTEYQYRTRSRTYILCQWTDWSPWQDDAVTASESTEIETRTLYAPDTDFLPSTIVVGREPSVTLVAGSACQLRYGNNEEGLIWQSSDPDVASVDSSGYLSAYKAGAATISVSGASIAVSVISQPDMLLPSQTDRVEDSAFESGIFSSIDMRSAAYIGEKALADNTRLKLVILNGEASIAQSAFDGSSHAIAASAGSPPDVSIPYYVIGPAKNYVDVSSVTLSQDVATLAKGRTLVLKADVNPAGATNPKLRWSSSDEGIAIVAEDGTVTGISEGTAAITVSASNGKKAVCTVHVTSVSVSSVSLNKTSLSLVAGNTSALTATVLPSDATNKGVVWSSGNTSVASVSSAGVVTGLTAGTAVIQATAADGSGKYATCTVTVTPSTVTSDANFTSVTADSITQTDATVRFTINLSGNPSSGGFYFGTSGSNLRLVKSENYSGTVREVFFNLNKYWGALAANTTYYYKMYYVYNGTTYETTVHSLTTLPNPVITPVNAHVEVGEGNDVQLSCSANPNYLQVTWTSSDSSIATVNSDGVAHGLKGGTVTITASVTYSSATATCSFQVDVNPIIYRFVLDINHQYTKEQLMSGFNLAYTEFEEFCLNHPFIGILTGTNGQIWTPSPAKVNDGAALANIYRQFLASRGQNRSDLHYYADIGKSALLSNIHSVFSAADDNDVNFFFYGGHGSNQNALFMKTGEIVAPVELLGAFKGIKGKNVLLLSSCYSGAFANTMKSYPYATGAVLAACEANHLSWSRMYDNVECSFDVYHFLRGIGFDEPSETKLATMFADSNSDGKVTVSEICAYMNANVHKPGNGEDEQNFVSWVPDGNVVIYSR